MLWFHRLQQRLSLTRNEAVTLIVLSVLFTAGLIARQIQQRINPISPYAYEETDRLFFERSAQIAAPVDPFEEANPVDSNIAVGPRSRHSHSAVGAARLNQNASSEASDPISSPIDLNRAGPDKLQQLPRIGPKTAERIIEFRETYGAFRHVDDLLQVRGIGPKTLEKLRPLVVVGNDSTSR